jgi:hypothetical protein
MKNKKFPLLFGLIAMVILSLPVAFAAQDEAWFDLENCSMCKHMSSEEGLMENMEWGNYLTKDGMMSVTVVAEGYDKAFKRSMKNMEATGHKLMAGEKLYMCGFCQSYGALHMAGANFENFETDAGYINLATSHDPAVIEKIHAHGQRTIDEYDKMVAAESKGHSGHEGHDHPDH